MKLKLLSVSIMATFIILITSTVFAAKGTVDFKANIDKVKAGETIIVTLSARSEDGINGINTKFFYNSKKLELTSAKLVDSSKWSNMGASPDITVICNSTDSIKSADIYILKFKVKDNVSVGDILKIETNDILLDTDAGTNSEILIEAKKVEVKVIGDTANKPTNPADEEPKGKPTDSTNEKTEDKPTNPTNEKSKDKSANTTNEKTEDKSANSTNEKTEDKPANSTNEKQKDKPSNLVDDKEKEKTVTSTNVKQKDKREIKELPKTGVNSLIIFVLIVIAIVLAFIFRKKYIKYEK